MLVLRGVVLRCQNGRGCRLVRIIVATSAGPPASGGGDRRLQVALAPVKAAVYSRCHVGEGCRRYYVGHILPQAVKCCLGLRSVFCVCVRVQMTNQWLGIRSSSSRIISLARLGNGNQRLDCHGFRFLEKRVHGD